MSHSKARVPPTMSAMRTFGPPILAALLAISCNDASQPSKSAPATAPQPSAAIVAYATLAATPSPTPTATPIKELPCADLDAFLDRIRPARVAAAGPVSSPAVTPTVPPPDMSPPPLGQYLLAESPIQPFVQLGFDGFIRTSQDVLGPDVWGQSRELALQSGLLGAYGRSFLAGSQPGGLLVYVHEFWSVDGALSFDEGATRNTCLYGGSIFEIPGVPGAIGQRFRNGAQYALRATFVVGKRRYLVMLTTTTLMPAEEIAYPARFAVKEAR